MQRSRWSIGLMALYLLLSLANAQETKNADIKKLSLLDRQSIIEALSALSERVSFLNERVSFLNERILKLEMENRELREKLAGLENKLKLLIPYNPGKSYAPLLPTALAAYCPMDNTLDDMIGGRKYSVSGDIRYEPGVFAYAARFDGKTAVSLDTDKPYFGNASNSISFWFQAYEVKTQCLLYLDNDNDWEHRSLFYLTPQGICFTYHGYPANRTVTLIRNGTDYLTWTHVVLTESDRLCNGNPEICKLYVNGRLAAQGTVICTHECSPTKSGRLGWCRTAHPAEPMGFLQEQYFYGLLDDVAIWNRILQESEIVALYQAGCVEREK